MKRPEQCETNQEFCAQFKPGAFPAAKTHYTIARTEFLAQRYLEAHPELNLHTGILDSNPEVV